MQREIDEAWIDEAMARYRRLDTLRAEFDQAVTSQVVSVHSPDDSIEVLVTAAGEITDVRIRGSLHHRSAAELAAQMQAVVGAATDAARWARDKLHQEIFSGFRAFEEG